MCKEVVVNEFIISAEFILKENQIEEWQQLVAVNQK